MKPRLIVLGVIGGALLLCVVKFMADHWHDKEMPPMESVDVLWTVTSDGSDVGEFVTALNEESRHIGDEAINMMNRYSNGSTLKDVTNGKIYKLVGVRADSVEPKPRTIENIVALAKMRGLKEAPPEVAFLLRKKSQEELGHIDIALTTPYLRKSLYWQPWEAGAFTLQTKPVDNEYKDCLDVIYSGNDSNWGNDWLFIFLAPDAPPEKKPE